MRANSGRGTMGQSLALQDMASYGDGHLTKGGQNMQDFLLYFSPASSDSKLLEAIHALYYLPQNFKLVLNSEADVQHDEVKSWAMHNIMSRIRFGDETGLSCNDKTTPFYYANVVIGGEDTVDFTKSSTPWVLVSNDTTDEIADNDHHGYTVATGNPEAFASAVLRIARTQYA